MEKIIRKVLVLWGIETKRISQVYSSSWMVNDSCVVKIYYDQKQLDRNISILERLAECGIPAARILLTKSGEKYVEYENTYFLVTNKLLGSNLSDIRDRKLAGQMGCAIAQLHKALLECEKVIEIWDNSLLTEMRGWIKEKLEGDGWRTIERGEYLEITGQLERMYDGLPKQLIHRDVHFGNFLFSDGELSGYLDFDLSQRNIRIFDICYLCAGLLAEEEFGLKKDEWIDAVAGVIAGYESVNELNEQEKAAISCVMECIEILFAAYFIGEKDVECAGNARDVLHFIRGCERDIETAIRCRCHNNFFA